MLEPPEPSHEIVEWLSALRLSQYIRCFRQRGYQALEDCKDLTDERLLELEVLPTGHRRRILRSLEALGLKQQSGEDDEEDGVGNGRGRRKPALYPRHIFLKDKKRGTSYQHQPKDRTEYDLEGSQTLPTGASLGTEAETLPESRHVVPPKPAPRNPKNIQKSVQVSGSARSSSSSSESLSTSEIYSDSSEDPLFSGANAVPGVAKVPLPPLSEDIGGFHGDMVENSIYEAQTSIKRGPQLTRSYRLRHRPVPKIPADTVQDRY